MRQPKAATLGTDLMKEHQARQERDKKLRSALTVGQLRKILDNITSARDDIPVVIMGMEGTGEFFPVEDWRGERWAGDINVLALYSGELSRE